LSFGFLLLFNNLEKSSASVSVSRLLLTASDWLALDEIVESGWTSVPGIGDALDDGKDAIDRPRSCFDFAEGEPVAANEGGTDVKGFPS
jgi:hypothetical protein